MDALSIRTFVRVADLQSFSKAADVLYLTQPAISKRIAALEEELESRLFDRLGKKILLTEAGKELYPRAKRILLELDDSRRAILNLSKKISGCLSFGTSHHIGLHRLPPVLRKFTNRYPEVELDIRFLDSETAFAAVEGGDLEIALVTMPNMTPPNIKLTPVWDDPLEVVVGREHPLVTDIEKHVLAINPANLTAYPAILPGSNTFTRKLIDSAFGKKGLSLTVKLATNYLETIKMLVTVGLGWSVLPSSMIIDDHLKILQVKGIRLKRLLGVVRHRKRTLSNAARAMMAMLVEPGNE